MFFEPTHGSCRQHHLFPAAAVGTTTQRLGSPNRRRPVPVLVLVMAVVLVDLLAVVQPSAALPRTSWSVAKRYHGGVVVGPVGPEEDPSMIPVAAASSTSASYRHRTPHQHPLALQSWREGSCLDDTVYAWCFMCGKIVESRDIYYGCCRREKRVMTFCEQLLS
jgi:hypothetical protein